MARRRHHNRCPGKCSAAAPNLSHIPADILLKAGLSDEWTARAGQCGYCGCVYSMEYMHGKAALVARGYFVGEIFAKDKWVPVNTEGDFS